MTDPELDLEELLAEERAALLSGRLADLAELADRKEALFASLAAGDPRPRKRLALLRREAERNAELLEAAARGIRTAQRRVGQIRAASGPLETYSQDGRRQTLTAGRGALERRA